MIILNMMLAPCNRRAKKKGYFVIGSVKLMIERLHLKRFACKISG